MEGNKKGKKKGRKNKRRKEGRREVNNGRLEEMERIMKCSEEEVNRRLRKSVLS